MVFSIDLDRGVWMRTHPGVGMDVYMYVDDPGVYYDAHGNQVSKAIAEAAGFDVEKLEVEHKRKTAVDDAMKEIDAKFGTSKPKVHAEQGGFTAWDMGMGRFNVKDAQGNVLNKDPISKEQAEVLLKHLAPKPKAKDEAKK